MENATKAILLGAGIVITLVLVSLGFMLLNGAIAPTNEQINDMQTESQQLMEQKFTKYDGATVNGSEVLNALQSFKNDTVCVRVTTKKSTTDYFYRITNSTTNEMETGGEVDLAPTKEKISTKYINPSGKFRASVIRDTNETITGIFFEQETT